MCDCLRTWQLRSLFPGFPLEEYDSEFATIGGIEVNNFEEEDWRDEDGCGKVTEGRNSTRIKDLNQVKNLLVILNRLVILNGNLVINRQNVSLGNDILLQDSNGTFAVFTPICVIHHSGEVIGNTTIFPS